MASTEIRCPRCNALKVVGCSGSCALCKSGCDDAEREPKASLEDSGRSTSNDTAGTSALGGGGS
jgi:hypothetical protein